MSRVELEILISEALCPLGFKKKRSTWYRQAVGVLQVFNLQKSMYGEQFYINICFVPDGIEVEGFPTPKEYKCPIRARIGVFFSENEKYVEGLFDLEKKQCDDVEHTNAIRSVLGQVVSIFDKFQKPADLKNAIELGAFKRAFLNRDVYRVLGLTAR